MQAYFHVVIINNKLGWRKLTFFSCEIEEEVDVDEKYKIRWDGYTKKSWKAALLFVAAQKVKGPAYHPWNIIYLSVQ